MSVPKFPSPIGREKYTFADRPILPAFMKRESHKNQVAEYNTLVKEISGSYARAQTKTANAVNANLIEAYWHIGRYIAFTQLVRSLRTN